MQLQGLGNLPTRKEKMLNTILSNQKWIEESEKKREREQTRRERPEITYTKAIINQQYKLLAHIHINKVLCDKQLQYKKRRRENEIVESERKS